MPTRRSKDRAAPAGAPLALALAVRACYEGRLRQEDLAAELGVHQTKVSKWATGVMRPTVDDIAAIEDACGRSRGFVLALSGHISTAGVVESRRHLAKVARAEAYALAAEKGGTADLRDTVRKRGRSRPRPGATKSGD
jgi:transcriptional regulator with XRE-family HTH domain